MENFKIIFLHDEKIFFDNFFSRLELYVSTFDSSAIYHSAIPWSTLTAAYVSKTPSDGGTPDFYNGAFISDIIENAGFGGVFPPKITGIHRERAPIASKNPEMDFSDRVELVLKKSHRKILNFGKVGAI